jgi:hypothetical protein
MNTFGIRSFILWAALAVALLGFAPGRTLAQQGNPPPAQQPPRAGAVPRPVPPAPPLSSADTDGAGWLGITMAEVNGTETTVNVEVSAAARPGSRPGQRPAIPI